MNSLVVSKFGGTSMKDAECMLRSADVAIKQNSNIIVVSATSGTTNDLIALAQNAEKTNWTEIEPQIKKIKDRHLKIAEDLKLESDLKSNLVLLLDNVESLTKGISLMKECSDKTMDTMQSFGERLSSVLFVQAMNNQLKKNNSSKTSQFFDVRDVLVTDKQFGKAKPLISEIEKNVKRLF